MNGSIKFDSFKQSLASIGRNSQAKITQQRISEVSLN